MTDTGATVRAVSMETVDVAKVQARTVRVLAFTQAVSGVGALAGTTASGLLAASVGGSAAAAGYAQGAQVAGASAFVLPLVWLMQRGGRRRGLASGYLTALVGAGAAVLGGHVGSLALVLGGLFLYGAATSTALQTRYAATDLAQPARRARALAIVMWTTTVGVVIGPNLVAPAGTAALAIGLPRLTGAYLVSVVSFGLAAATVLVLLRPDPLLLARLRSGTPAVDPNRVRTSAWSSVNGRVALLSMMVGHVVMLTLMVMTPVHMAQAGTGLAVVGAALSSHVLGMYAMAPVFGWLSDRYGRRTGLLVGSALLTAAALVLGTAGGHASIPIAAGLFLLGLGWSATLVSGSVLLGESVHAADRTRTQGMADMLMGAGAATGGLLAGPLISAFGYGALAQTAAVLSLGLVVTQVLTRLPRREVAGANP